MAQNGIESLKLGRFKKPTDLADQEVLVELHAASLNYRDIVYAQVCLIQNANSQS